MVQEGKNRYMEKNIAEREINLIDMFWAACLKWRQILLWAVIFALLAGGVSYLKNVRTAKKAAEPTVVSLDEIELDEDSKNNANAYLEYKQIYADQIMYNVNAPLMQLDSNGFYRSIVTYYVDNHFVVEYPLVDKSDTTDAIVEAYKARLRSEEFTGKLKELVGSDEKISSYVKELIDCDNNYGKTNMTVDGTGIMRISIYGADEQTCKGLAELVKEAISSGKATITEQLGEHDIALIEDCCEYMADIELLKYQQENVSKLSTYSNTIRDLKGKLTEDELSYIDVYEKEQAELEGETATEEENISLKASVSIKYVVVGIVGGAALAFFVIVLMYLFNSRLRLEDDFEMIYGVKLLGSVIIKDEGKKKWFAFLDQFFIKMRHLNKHYFTEAEAVSMVAAGIKIGAKKFGTTKVFVTGAVVGKEEKSVIEQLKKELKKTGIELVQGKPILYDAEALEQSAEVGCLVLVERAGASLYDEVAEEIEVCMHQGAKVLGAVVVA